MIGKCKCGYRGKLDDNTSYSAEEIEYICPNCDEIFYGKFE